MDTLEERTVNPEARIEFNLWTECSRTVRIVLAAAVEQSVQELYILYYQQLLNSVQELYVLY